MKSWRPPKRLQLRRHANGRIAEVYLQHDGRFYARDSFSDNDLDRCIRFRDNIDTLKLAQVLADRVAHPNCRGRCPAWQDDPATVHDPDCQAALGHKQSA